MKKQKFSHKILNDVKKCPFCGGIPGMETIDIIILDDNGKEILPPSEKNKRIYCTKCGFGFFSNNDNESLLIHRWEKRI